MSASGWEQLLFIAAVTAVAAPLLGRYLAATFRGASASTTSASKTSAPGDRVFLPVENLVYRALGTDPGSSWTWRGYALAVLAFGLLSTLPLYTILLLQGPLPLEPTHAARLAPRLSFTTPPRFLTRANWQ